MRAALRVVPPCATLHAAGPRGVHDEFVLLPWYMRYLVLVPLVPICNMTPDDSRVVTRDSVPLLQRPGRLHTDSCFRSGHSEQIVNRQLRHQNVVFIPPTVVCYWKKLQYAR